MPLPRHPGLRAAIFFLLLSLPLCAQDQKEKEKRWKELNGQLFFLKRQGLFAQELSTAQEGVKAAEAAFGREHRFTGNALANLADAYSDRGNYVEAERYFRQALEVFEKVRGPEHYDVAMALQNLASQLMVQARYIEAEAALRRALSIEEKVWGDQHPKLGVTLTDIAELYEAQGKYAEAEAYLRRVVVIMDAWRLPLYPDEGAALSSLGDLFLRTGRLEEAEALYRRALKIADIKAAAFKATGNPMYRMKPQVALATVARVQGHYAEAESLLRQVLARADQSLGPDTPLQALIHRQLGGTLFGQGKSDEAAASYQHALALYEKNFGPDHPKVGDTAEDLAALYYARGQPQEAGPYFDRRIENLSRQFQYHFAYMSEKERLGFLDALASTFPLYFSFCYANRDRDPALLGKMYDVVLWQKGFVAASVAAVRSQIAARADSGALAELDQLQAKKTQLARLITSPPLDREEGRRLVAQLEQETNELERSLARRYVSLAEEKRLERVTWRDVQKTLRPGEAAVEFLRFRFHDGKRLTDTAYYIALVLTPETANAPLMVLLGEAATLEGPVLDGYRRIVERKSGAGVPGPSDVSPSAYWQPLEGALAGKERIFLSPDGVLNLVSLALITAGDGKLLSEKYDLHVLTSTKDLLRAQASGAADSAVLIGNPRFDLTEEQRRAAIEQLGHGQPAPVVIAQVAPSSALRSSRQGGALEPLPGTAAELASVRQVLERRGWQVAAFQEAAALEEAVKRVKRPRLLHLATHGYFLSDQVGGLHDRSADLPVGLEDPMLRSGLFLAGVERSLQGAPPPAGVEDGVLTAYEASALDLQGTELVVLSACETGLGQVRNGEGVFGLRRAFQIAGARAVLMSLWSVPDRETQELMELFYEKWLAGADKHDALREAQLEIRQRVRQRYGADLPYYWGAFIVVGP